MHNLIILDESGSMNSIKHSIIQGFNVIVQTVKGISNTMVFEKDDTGMKMMFAKEKSARYKYSQNLEVNAETNTDFYKEDK